MALLTVNFGKNFYQSVFRDMRPIAVIIKLGGYRIALFVGKFILIVSDLTGKAAAHHNQLIIVSVLFHFIQRFERC